MSDTASRIDSRSHDVEERPVREMTHPFSHSMLIGSNLISSAGSSSSFESLALRLLPLSLPPSVSRERLFLLSRSLLFFSVLDIEVSLRSHLFNHQFIALDFQNCHWLLLHHLCLDILFFVLSILLFFTSITTFSSAFNRLVILLHHQSLASPLQPLLGLKLHNRDPHRNRLARAVIVSTVVVSPFVVGRRPIAKVNDSNVAVGFEEGFDFVACYGVARSECLLFLAVIFGRLFLLLLGFILHLHILDLLLLLLLLLFLRGSFIALFNLFLDVIALLLFLLNGCGLFFLLLLLGHRNILHIQTQISPIPHLPPVKRHNPPHLRLLLIIHNQPLHALTLSGPCQQFFICRNLFNGVKS
mmetsp:Transcript_4051/g.6364  ORF Transcript_4051/g.6364 Transcript_4051/m.6364 type:complete len:357 (+) Transcript_4051:399-1469(+)